MFEHMQTRVMEWPQDLGAGSRGHWDGRASTPRLAGLNCAQAAAETGLRAVRLRTGTQSGRGLEVMGFGGT